MPDQSAVEKLMDAKFKGVEDQLTTFGKTLDRVVDAIEKQGELNVAVAQLAVRMGHVEDGLASHRTATSAAMRGHDKRLTDVEDKSSFNSWRISAAHGVVGAIGAIVAVLASHLDGVRRFFTG